MLVRFLFKYSITPQTITDLILVKIQFGYELHTQGRETTDDRENIHSNVNFILFLYFQCARQMNLNASAHVGIRMLGHTVTVLLMMLVRIKSWKMASSMKAE